MIKQICMAFTFLLIVNVSCAKSLMRPTTSKELEQVTVMITDKMKTSGGTGVIFSSSDKESFILTNSHVCGLLENGGLIATSKGEYSPELYKRSQVHDICVIQVVADLRVSTVLAPNTPEFGDKLKVSGHPYLLPTMVSEGYLSKLMEIQLVTGLEKCTSEELEKYPFLCIFVGGLPIVKTFSTYSTSVLIAPGNSGSGVFNDNGELVGLVFAGMGNGLSHGFIVPLEYIKLFVDKESKTLRWQNANVSQKMKPEPKPSRESTPVDKIPNSKILLTKENLDKLVYPEIKNSNMETLIEKLNICKTNMEKCRK